MFRPHVYNSSSLAASRAGLGVRLIPYQYSRPLLSGLLSLTNEYVSRALLYIRTSASPQAAGLSAPTHRKFGDIYPSEFSARYIPWRIE